MNIEGDIIQCDCPRENFDDILSLQDDVILFIKRCVGPGIENRCHFRH
jgi:hypothetical protein